MLFLNLKQQKKDNIIIACVISRLMSPMYIENSFFI